MINDQFVLKVERLRDSLEDLRNRMRSRYRLPNSQVISEEIRSELAKIAEIWMVDIAPKSGVVEALGDDTIADLNIQFQRLLTYSEQSTLRKKYDAAVKNILSDFRAHVIIPLKQRRDQDTDGTIQSPRTFAAAKKGAIDSIFVGHSFSKEDEIINDVVLRFLVTYGLRVLTGERPSANTVSAKVRSRIEQCDAFLGIFTRRDKIARKEEWSPSPWIVDEKAYALAKNKKLILLRELGVQSIGGLQGDYEYLEFDRANTGDLLVRLLETLKGLESD
jgi:hypothetical protein